MQGVAQLTTGFSNKYHCDINQLMCLVQLLFDQYFRETKHSGIQYVIHH